MPTRFRCKIPLKIIMLISSALEKISHLKRNKDVRRNKYSGVHPVGSEQPASSVMMNITCCSL